ncbi:serine/threonine-protein kinase [Streptomyces nitrosporeus]|uniref:serine/threonine-protein kinase n=1 Tax=Streptomyces nitrosporeus TaxID=28894 RepID=UPI003329D1A3
MDDLRPQDPERIGTYRLLARLGAGGMGRVFLGRSPGGRLVAVKVIHDEISEHPEALARFRREAETVRAVRSACTARLIDASLDASPYWLATEYVAGPTLGGAVRAGGPFPPATALLLCASLAEGLAAVHAHGVVHRDLKPQNVILSPQGPQLIDFGIARGFDQTVLTREGMASGTPGFAAPEVVLRNEAGPAADVFALGATLAYAVTGRPPFGTGDSAVVSYRAVHEDIDLAGADPSLAALIRSCVAKDPADRPGPAALIARCGVDSAIALDPHYRSLAEAAGAPGGGAPEPPAPEPAAPGPTAQLPDGGATTVPVAPRAAPAPAVPGRRGRLVRAVAVVCAMAAAGTAGWLLSSPDGTEDGGGGPGASGAASGPADRASASPSATAPAGPPDHIVGGDRVSQDRWTLSEDPDEAAQGMGSCDLGRLGLATSLPGDLHSSVSHTTGSDTATVTLRPENAGQGRRPDPYYVAVGVRPPHGTDPATGLPTKEVSEGIGFTSEPVDLYARWSKGGTIVLRYPEDFRAHLGGRTLDALPVGRDRGDWTVVLYHVEGAPDRYTSVVCNGFHA